MVADEWWKKSVTLEAERCTVACGSRLGLAHYVQVVWAHEGKWALNKFLHDTRVPPNEAILVSRLLAGGQWLRGGDSGTHEVVSVDNCCVFCLDSGVRCVESAWHVLFVCDCYSRARLAEGVDSILANPVGVFSFHRGVWGWRELRTIRHYIVQVWLLRCSWVGVHRRKIAQRLSERAHRLWLG